MERGIPASITHAIQASNHFASTVSDVEKVRRELCATLQNQEDVAVVSKLTTARNVAWGKHFQSAKELAVQYNIASKEVESMLQNDLSNEKVLNLRTTAEALEEAAKAKGCGEFHD